MSSYHSYGRGELTKYIIKNSKTVSSSTTRNYEIIFILHGLNQNIDMFGDPWERRKDIMAINEEEAREKLYAMYPEIHQSRVEVLSIKRVSAMGSLVFAC